MSSSNLCMWVMSNLDMYFEFHFRSFVSEVSNLASKLDSSGIRGGVVVGTAIRANRYQKCPEKF